MKGSYFFVAFLGKNVSWVIKKFRTIYFLIVPYFPDHFYILIKWSSDCEDHAILLSKLKLLCPLLYCHLRQNMGCLLARKPLSFTWGSNIVHSFSPSPWYDRGTSCSIFDLSTQCHCLSSAFGCFKPKTARALSALGSCLICLEGNFPSSFLFVVLFVFSLLIIILLSPCVWA